MSTLTADKDETAQIFHFGRRRCGSFLSRETDLIPEGFGICQIGIFVAALPNAEARIKWLREYCASKIFLPTTDRNLPSLDIIRIGISDSLGKLFVGADPGTRITRRRPE